MKKIASASLALVIAGTALAAWSTLNTRSVLRPVSPFHLPLDLPESTATLLHRAGLTPNSMAAAGCTLEHVNGIIDLMSVKAQMPGFVEDLEAATLALNTRLNQTLTHPPAENADTATVVERREAVEALLDDAFTFATTGIANSSQQSLLASIRANARWSAIPAPYLVVDRPPNENLRLRQALTATAQAARQGRPQPEGTQAIIEAADGDALVTAARAAYDANLEAIQAVWDQRVEAR